MKIKQIGQAIPQWLIDGAEKAGNKVADIKEKAPVLVDDIKNAYQRGLNKPKQMDLFEDQPQPQDIFEDQPNNGGFND